MSKVSYDPESLILTSEGVIYVLNRRGIFNIRARNIDRLHEALKPHLDGTHDEAALLASVPAPQQPTIRHYLSKLREVGALRAADATELGAARGEADSPAAPTTRAGGGDGRAWTATTPAGKSVFVSLIGPRRDAIRRHDACLFFVTPEQMRHELLTLDRWRHRPGPIIYVLAAPAPPADGGAEAEALRRHGRYARWMLLTSENLLEQRDAVAVYRLDEASCTLSRLLVTQSSPSALRGVPAQLDLINVANVPQVPLVVARAGHALFPMTITKMGLRYESLYEDLAREFGARAALAECVRHGASSLPAKSLARRGPKSKPDRVLVDGGDVASWQVADSLLHLRARLLEHHADDCARPDDLSACEDLDLLEAVAEHEDVRYLVGALRLRVRALPTRVARSAAGLFVCECRGRRGVSFVRAKAVRDALLINAWDTFYSDAGAGAPTPQNDYETFVPDAELRRVVSEREAELTRLYGPVRFLYRKIRCLGRAAWAGRLEREALGDGR